MKQFILLSVTSLIAGNTIAKEKAESRPNVLFIVLDDMNGYGSRNEYPVKMPYLEKFKKQAINFTAASCQSPVCNPSRASFLSGMYPHNTGAYLNGSDVWNKPANVLYKNESLVECFKHNGYETWGRGKLFHSPLDSAREYGMFDNRPIYLGGFGPHPDPNKSSIAPGVQPWTGSDTDFPDVKNADVAIEFLKQKHEKPFFIFYGLWRPHQPYTAPKRFFDLYDPDKLPLPDGYKPGDLDDVPFMGRLLVDSLAKARINGKIDIELYKKYLWGYAANSAFADWNLGRVIEALDQSKYASNTIVVLISDNGYHCGEKLRWEKATLWEQADYVPMLIRTPKTKGAECIRTVALVDIYPTLVEYCKLSPPAHKLDGRSMVPLINNPQDKWDRPSFTSYNIENSSVRDERYRFIRYPNGDMELYDHQTDPHEFNNVAGLPENKTIIERLSKEIPTQWVPSFGGKWEVKRK